MRKHNLILTALLGIALGLQAQTLTVANSTTFNEYTPFDGWYMDMNQHNQILYPASMLVPMSGSYIGQMTWYLYFQANNPWGAQATIKVAIVSQTSLTGLMTLDDTAWHTVWQGVVNGNTSEIPINFSSPFLYSGGSLLVDIATTTGGIWAQSAFYGVNQTGGSYRSCGESDDGVVDFIPKATFLYSSTGAFCLAPTSLTATQIGGTDVTVEWNGSSSAYGVEYGEQGFVPGTGTAVTTTVDSLHITGLAAGTTYDVYVWGICTGDNSDTISYTFTTTSTIVGVPYSTGFEDGDDVAWQMLGSNNPWAIGTAVNSTTGGSHAMYISNNGGTSNAMDANTASISYAVRPLYVESGEYLVGFDWRNNGVANMWGMTFSSTLLYAFLAPTATTSLASLAANGMPDEDTWIYINEQSLDGVTSWQHFENSVSVDSAGDYYLVFMYYNYGSGGTAPPAAVDNVQIYPNNCPQPVALTVASVGADSISVQWTPGGSEDMWLARVADGDWTPVYDTAYTFLGLTPNTIYNIDLVSVCSNGDTSMIVSVQERTACGLIATFPWTEDFNSFTSNTAPLPCWLSKGGGYYQMATYGTTDNQTTFLSFRPTGMDGGIAVMPEFANVNTLEITFTTAPEGSASGSFSIGYVPASAVGATLIDTEFVALETYPVAAWDGSYVFLEKTVSLTSLPDSARIAFRHYPGSTNWYWYLDNINLHPIPSCQRPFGLEIASVDSNSATIVWSDTNVGTPDFLVEWCHNDSSVWHSVTVSDTSASLIGLASGAVYNIRVSAVCGTDATSMPLQGSLHTACPAVTYFPFEENFDNASVVDCWMAYDYDGVSEDNWSYSSSYTNNHNNSLGAMVSHYNYTRNGNNWLVSPAFVLPSDMDNITLAWFSKGLAYQTSMPHLEVRVSSTSPIDTTAFTTVYAADLNETDYVKHTVSLNQFAGETIYIAFVRSSYDDDDLYIDDLSIYSAAEPLVSIVGSTAPTVGIATTFAANLTDGSRANLTYTWSSARATAGTATMTIVDSANISILYPSTGADTIALIATNTFGADSAYLIVVPEVVGYTALPYSTGFEPGDDVAWTLSNGTNNGWYIDSAVNNGGRYSMYISSNNGTNNTYDITAVSNSFAYKMFGFSEAGSYGLSFDWRCYGEASSIATYDYLEVYLAPASSDVVGGNIYTTIPSSWENLTGRMALNSNWQNYSTFFDIPNAGAYKIVFRWYNDGSAGTNPPAAIDNVSLVFVSCAAPVALSFDSITTNSSSFHWSAAGSESAWEVTVGNLAPVVVNDTHYTTPATLNPSTFYNVRVRAICSAGDTSLALSGSFTTECLAFGVPFYYGFDSTMLDGCWDNVYTAPAPTYPWSAPYANQTAHQIFSSASATASPANDWLISPQITISAADTANLELVYYVKGNRDASYGSSQATYEVYVSPTGSAEVGTFTDTITVETIDTNVFVRRSFAMSQYVGQTVRVAFRNRSAFYGRVYLYEVGIRRTTMPLYTIAGADVAFTGDLNTYNAVHVEGDTGSVTYSWTSAMAAAGNANMTAATSAAMQITYSAAGTDTITLVVANGFGTDTLQSTVTVYDCSTITTFPWTEHFDNAGDIVCWIQSGNGVWSVAVGDHSESTGTQAGTGNLRIKHSYTGNKTLIISPVLNLTGVANPQLTFWHIERSWSGDIDHLRVFGRTSETAPWDTLAAYTTAFSVWTPDTIALTGASATYQIAFEMHDNYGYGVGIDELTIASGATCQAPVITGIVRDENALTVNYSSDADSVEVIVTDGLFDPAASGVIATGGSYTATGLTHSTTYTVALRAYCSQSSISDWTVDTASTLMVDCQTPTNLAVQATTYTTATIGWTVNGIETAWGVRAYNTIDTFNFVANTNPFTITGLTSGVTYNVEVRALCGQNSDIEGDWSDALQVTTDVCAPVTDVAVSDITSNSATVSWNAATGALGYKISYGDSNFYDADAHTVEVDANTTSYAMTGLDADWSYEVFVQTKCGDNLYSSVATEDRIAFHTASSSEGIYDVESGTLTLYPNPASTSVTLSVSGIDGEATVEVVDMNGRTVATYTTVNHELGIDVSSLGQGAYFVRVTGERQTAVRKLIVR